MANLLELAGYVQKQGDLGRQRGEQSRLASLASQAYTAPRADRQGLLGQMAQTSPDAAVAQQKLFRQGDSDRMADLSRKAKLFVGMAETGNAQAVAALYPQIAQEARDLGLGDIPLEYNDTFLPGLKKFASILDGNADNPYAGLPSDIQSLKLLQSDPTLAALDRERRQAAGMVPKQVQTSQGIGWGTPGGGIELAPITGVAGGAGNGGFGIKETNDYVQSILGKVQGLDPNAPAEKQAEALLPYLIQQESGGDPNAVSPKGAQGLTQVMPATGRDPGFGVSPLRDNSPQENVRFGRDYLTAMLRRYPGRPDLALAAYNAGPGVADRFANPQASAGPTIAQPFQKPQAPSELDRRIETARAMDASEDEIRRLVLGKDGSAPDAKPIPVGSLNKVLEAQEALGATQVISDIIQKHARRMQSGELVVGPVDTIGAKFRTGIGMANAQDVNLNEWEADKTKIVNESLRLNKGVQTEGDAQRAIEELMGARDQATAARALRRLAEINARAVQLQKQKLTTIYSNYGRGADGEPVQRRQPAQSGGVDDLLSKYGAN